MPQTKKQTQVKNGRTNTGGDDVIDTEGATPEAKPLNTEQQAFQLASKNKIEIDELRKEINQPRWASQIVNAVETMLVSLKIILIIFLLLLILSLIIFLIVSFVELNCLINVLEVIRDNKTMEFNDELLKSFNFFYNDAQKIIKSQLVIIGVISVITILAGFFVKISNELLKFLCKKKK